MSQYIVRGGLAHHRRVFEAGNSAIGLWARVNAWLTEQNRDRPAVKLREAVTMGSARDAERLVSAGLWAETRVDGEPGYLVMPHAELFHSEPPALARRRAVDRDRQRRLRAHARGDHSLCKEGAACRT